MKALLAGTPAALVQHLGRRADPHKGGGHEWWSARGKGRPTRARKREKETTLIQPPVPPSLYLLVLLAGLLEGLCPCLWREPGPLWVLLALLLLLLHDSDLGNGLLLLGRQHGNILLQLIHCALELSHGLAELALRVLLLLEVALERVQRLLELSDGLALLRCVGARVSGKIAVREMCILKNVAGTRERKDFVRAAKMSK